MVQYHKHSKTKYSGTGGKKRSTLDKVKVHYGGFFAHTRVSKEEKRERVDVKGRGEKGKAHAVSFANVASKGKIAKSRISTVTESPDNRHYARENVITKGALIQTELGIARVTSRPGQDGLVNAVLVTAAVPTSTQSKAEVKAEA